MTTSTPQSKKSFNKLPLTIVIAVVGWAIALFMLVPDIYNFVHDYGTDPTGAYKSGYHGGIQIGQQYYSSREDHSASAVPAVTAMCWRFSVAAAAQNRLHPDEYAADKAWRDGWADGCVDGVLGRSSQRSP